jgi:hypothetical protein
MLIINDIKEFNMNAVLEYYKNPDEEEKGLSYEEVNTIIVIKKKN